MIFSWRAIKIDITRSKLRQESYEARVKFKIYQKNHWMAYDKQAREVQHSKREEEGGRGQGLAAWVNLFLDLIKV